MPDPNPPVPSPSPQPSPVPTDDDTRARRRVDFDPAVHGFAFPNAFVDELITLPNGTTITTAGRCGGMSYAVLDYFLSGRPVPRWSADLYAPQRVPPDENWLARYVQERQLQSFLTGSATKFVTWTLHSDHETWVFKGVSRWTKEEEVPRVIGSIDAGRPVVLGLVVARSLGKVGDNHQVVAYGYDVDDASGRVALQVYDPNSPGREVLLTSEPGQKDWSASNGRRWRGFFVQDYTPKPPRVLTRTAPSRDRQVSTGDVVKLSHVWTGRSLHSHGLAYTHPGSSGQQQVTAFDGSDDNDLWRLAAPHGNAVAVGDGHALRHGDVLRLRHVETGRNLHSHRRFPSPLTGQQEVTAFGRDGVGDAGDDWRVEVDGGGRWRAGSRVRLVHVGTGVSLHSHRRTDPQLTAGQQEVTGFTGRDGNDWWTVLEVR